MINNQPSLANEFTVDVSVPESIHINQIFEVGNLPGATVYSQTSESVTLFIDQLRLTRQFVLLCQGDEELGSPTDTPDCPVFEVPERAQVHLPWRERLGKALINSYETVDRNSEELPRLAARSGSWLRDQDELLLIEKIPDLKETFEEGIQGYWNASVSDALRKLSNTCRWLMDNDATDDKTFAIAAGRALISCWESQGEFKKMEAALSDVADIVAQVYGPGAAVDEIVRVADVYFTLGGLEYIRAKGLYEMAIDRNPSKSRIRYLRYRLARIHHLIGDYHKAIIEYQKVYNEHPRGMWRRLAHRHIKEAYVAIWRHHYKAMELDSADQWLRRAIRESRADLYSTSNYLFYIGYTNYFRRDYDEAVRNFGRAIESCPGSSPAELARAYKEKALIECREQQQRAQ